MLTINERHKHNPPRYGVLFVSCICSAAHSAADIIPTPLGMPTLQSSKWAKSNKIAIKMGSHVLGTLENGVPQHDSVSMHMI